MYHAGIMNWLKYHEIWVYSEPLDFRKQLNGLIEVVLGELGKRPDDGSLYVFRNRQRNKLKILVWDRNGYFMGYKRLEKGRFYFPQEKTEAGPVTMTADELYALVSGMPIVHLSGLQKPIFHH